MKTYFFIFIAVLFSLIGCTDKSEESTKKTKDKEVINAPEPSYNHILSEAYDEKKSIHYFDPNVTVYERMILPIDIDENGAMRLNGRSSSYEELAAEMRLFYFANKELGQRMTTVHHDDEFYKYKHYPFFVYFDKASFKSYLDRLESMAKNDSIAQKYLTLHRSRITSFDAVDDGIVLPFLEFGALIKIGYQEETDPAAIAEVENKVAENIHAFRNEIAQEEFGTSYDRIRDMARKEPNSKIQLMYLKEMVPAYIIKGNTEQTSTSLKEKPPLPPPPPVETIVVEENERG